MDTDVDLLARRKLLKLFSLSPLVALVPQLSLAADAASVSSFLQISRVLTDTDALTQDVADRIEALLKKRDAHFATGLSAITKHFTDASVDRASLVSALSGDDLRFAVEIIKPWYVGYVGTPSNSILKDDAEFATFLEAQSYQKILKEVPRQSYPPGSAGWWGAVPEGVTPPDMPKEVTDWRFHPADAPTEIISASPAWLAYVQGHYEDVDAARQARPAAL